jgi:hypothetical protein
LEKICAIVSKSIEGEVFHVVLEDGDDDFLIELDYNENFESEIEYYENGDKVMITGSYLNENKFQVKQLNPKVIKTLQSVEVTQILTDENVVIFGHNDKMFYKNYDNTYDLELLQRVNVKVIQCHKKIGDELYNYRVIAIDTKDFQEILSFIEISIDKTRFLQNNYSNHESTFQVLNKSPEVINLLKIEIDRVSHEELKRNISSKSIIIRHNEKSINPNGNLKSKIHITPKEAGNFEALFRFVFKSLIGVESFKEFSVKFDFISCEGDHVALPQRSSAPRFVDVKFNHEEGEIEKKN